jgi:SAM-dependent methyltransferase
MKKCLKCDDSFQGTDWLCPACGYEPEKTNGFVIHSPDISQSIGGYNPEHFEFLFRLEGRNFWFRNRNLLIQWAINVIAKSPKSFLEIGCGTGYVLRGIQTAVPSIELSGSEIFIEGLSFAQERLPDISLMQMDALCLPFVEEYECIGAFDVLEHIADDTRVLRQIYQALKPAGYVLLTVPQHKFLWSQADTSACHERRYSRGELERKCSDVGFGVLKSTSFVSLLLPLMYLSRRMNNAKSQSIANTYELDVNPILNELLYWILQLEQLLIRCGVSLPFGGSRLVICVKGA